MRRLETPCAIGLILLGAALAALGSGGESDDRVSRIRMGASTSLVGADINANDARAAIKTWADSFSRETGLRIESLPEVLSPPEQLFQNIRQGLLDAFSVTTPEYQQIAAYTDPGLLLVDQAYVNGGEEYIILVHAESGVRSLADLRGRTLAHYTGSVTSLAADWIETLLAGANLGAPESFFRQIVPEAKLSRTVLPVFFRQVDACVATRRAYETMCEMNPQLSVKLRILAGSPKLVPVVIAFHKNCSPRQKERFKAALTGMGNSPAGRQILSLFGSHQVIATDSSILGPSIELVQASARIRARAAGAGRK